MFALSLAYLGTLAFVGFRMWLQRRDDHGKRMDDLQTQIATVTERLHNHADNPIGAHADLKALIAPLKDVPERVGKLELAFQVRRAG